MTLSGTKVRELRNLLNLTRHDLAKAAKISIDTLEQIEKGHRKDGSPTEVKENTWRALARAKDKIA